jgi:hypothetical protein
MVSQDSTKVPVNTRSALTRPGQRGVEQRVLQPGDQHVVDDVHPERVVAQAVDHACREHGGLAQEAGEQCEAQRGARDHEAAGAGELPAQRCTAGREVARGDNVSERKRAGACEQPPRPVRGQRATRLSSNAWTA